MKNKTIIKNKNKFDAIEDHYNSSSSSKTPCYDADEDLSELIPKFDLDAQIKAFFQPDPKVLNKPEIERFKFLMTVYKELYMDEKIDPDLTKAVSNKLATIIQEI